MQTKTYNVYKFDELTDQQKEKVIQNLSDINVDYDWWNCTYEDAKMIGLEITSFDLDRNRHAKGKFISGAEECAHNIEKEHGESTETYKTAKNYLSERDAIIEKVEKDEHGEIVDEYELEGLLDECDAEFLDSLLEDYSIMLQHEYEYLQSEEAIIETIQANDYEFTEDGKLD